MNNEEGSMGRKDIAAALQEQFDEYILVLQAKSDRRIYVEIAPQTVVRATKLMLDEFGARFQIATGVDTEAGFEVMYHWALDDDDCVVTIRAVLPHEDPEVDSIAPICPAAEWIEREMWELLGIRFVGHPDMRHLLLDDDWPQDNYPLRRDHEVTS